MVGLLGVILVVLKALGYIDWTWTWVLAPFWVPVLVGIVIFLVVAGIVIIAEVMKK